MTLGVEWSSTERTEWTSGFDESNDGDGESRGPLAREANTQRGLLFKRLHRHLDGLFRLVDRDGNVTRDEVSFVFRLEIEVLGQVPGPTELLENLSDPFGERGELELLALHNDESATLSDLEEKEAGADLAAHANHDPVGVSKDVVHEGLRPFSELVLFTHSTIGVDPVKATALTEHGEMTVRWKRSSGTP